MPVTTPKPPWQSMTIWMVTLAALGWLRDKMGWNFTDSDVESLMNVLVPLVLAVWGRFRAKREVTMLGDGALFGPPAALFCAALMLCGCGTTGAQEQDARANEVDQRQWGGLFGKYEGGQRSGGKRVVRTLSPKLDNSGGVVYDAEGNPVMITVEIEESSAGPLVLNLGVLSANQDQGTQGEASSTGTQDKTDTATPTTDTDATLPREVAPMVRVKAGAVIVITDKEYGATFTGTSVWIDKGAIIVTVRDDATQAERNAAIRIALGGTA